MKNITQFNFVVNEETNTIYVERLFQAPIDLVWAAWTEADILDKWWAPKPWKTETKSMQFFPGGRWHYAMVSPEGEKHWCMFEYENIVSEKSFTGNDAFCDEHCNTNNTKPKAYWHNDFVSHDDSTAVNIQIKFDSMNDLRAIIEMGFKEGFTMGLSNLDEYINTQFYLRKQNKSHNQVRVSTYLNFPGNTEAAFTFYKSVFRSEFVGEGMQRFGDLPTMEGQPPISESLKNMIIHVELPILGGHILMGTDAPKEMGFTVEKGNNMHINLEPNSREEALRIFNALAEGGKVIQPMQDMFWGAYYGSLTDQFGINWMVNFQPK